MSKVKTWTSSICMIFFGGAALAQQDATVMANPYGDAAMNQQVLANPYEGVEEIQRLQTSVLSQNEIMIRELYERSTKRGLDPAKSIQARIASLRTEDVTSAQRAELLNLGTPEIEVEKVSLDSVTREAWVPSLSELERGETEFTPPENIFLKNWELTRTEYGRPVVGRVGDPMSRVDIRVGMILGEYGRVMAVRDTEDAFYVILESGDRIRGVPKSNG